MIVTRLHGGLGNQMFQYAAGRALALRRGAELRLDLRAFGHTETRPFGLGVFALAATPAEAGDLPRRGLLGRLQPRRTRRLTEKGLRFDASVLAAPDGTCLDGYWQSERYFVDRAADIRADFALKSPAPDAALLARAGGARTVSLHVRRGDYAANPDVNAVHGTCSPAYYSEAIAHLQAQVGEDLTAFVFSDDLDWVRANLHLPVETLHVAQAGGPEEDMRLMSACRHHVVANSSFSWWGAWLDPRPDARVIAPRRWFASDALDASDIVPERSVRI